MGSVGRTTHHAPHAIRNNAAHGNLANSKVSSAKSAATGVPNAAKKSLNNPAVNAWNNGTSGFSPAAQAGNQYQWTPQGMAAQPLPSGSDDKKNSLLDLLKQVLPQVAEMALKLGLGAGAAA